MKKTSTRLADGREIIYFDESDDATRVLVDTRDLPPLTTSSTLRYDAVAEEWVTIAAHRQDRTFLPPADQCPLCPSRHGHLTEIPSPDYDVVVFENRFPSFSSGIGCCEVMCFTAEHDSSFSALTPDRVRTVVEAWVDRTVALSARPAVAEVFCFENRGREIGVTLAHPHGQIYGYPFVTPTTLRRLDVARRYRAETSGHLLADVVGREVAAGVRIVSRTEHWTAFVPFAARWPVEVHLYPNDRVASLPELSEDQRHDFCQVYLDLLRRLEQARGADLPYVSGWHQAPVRGDRDLAYLHLELFSVRRAPGKLKYLAGSESAMGAFINDVVPEDLAAALRDQA
jgi:UDPglucose--hexose-1-phosphate uridylyltransferase